MKKLLLGLTTLATSTAPVLAVIACGGSTGFQGRYESTNDGKLVIQAAFSASGPQMKGLKDLVEEYNKTNPVMKVEVVGIEGGYSAIAPTLEMNFQAGDKKKTPNLVVAYPDVLGTLSKYDMQQKLTTNDAEKTRIKGLFDEQFIGINDQIGGLAPGDIYSLPIAKSIEMASLNTPVMHYILTELQKVSDLSSLAAGEAWSHVGDATASDAPNDNIKDIWGNIDTTKTTNIANIKQLIDDGFATIKDIFADGEAALTFVANAMPLFPTAQANKAYILGVDSATNFMYQAIHQKNEADYNKFLFKKGSDNYITYENWNNAKSDARKAFDGIYSKLKAALDAKGVYINTGGAYSSGLETQHKLGIAFGSTAGYAYNFKRGGSAYFTAGNDKVLLSKYTDTFTKDNTDANVIGTFGKYNNKILKSTAASAGKYDIQLESAAKDAEVINFIRNATTKANLRVSSNSDVSKLATNKKVQITTGKNPKYLIEVEGVTSTTTSLNENELEIWNTPLKYGKSTNKVQLIQGPSLIGVHVDDAEDVEMAKFIKWVTTGTNYTTFSDEAGYLVPTKTILGATNAPAGLNPAQTLTFNTLKEIQNDPTFFAFDNPVDDTTGTFRDTLSTTIAAQYTASDSDKPTATAAEIYTKVNRSL